MRSARSVLLTVLAAAACGGSAVAEGPAPTGIQPDSSNDSRCPATTPTHLSDDDEYCYDPDIRCGYQSQTCHDVFVCTCFEGCGWVRDAAAQGTPCDVPCNEADGDEPCAAAGETCERPGEEVNGPVDAMCGVTCEAGNWRIDCPMP